jgi:hypothetical protein
MASNERPAGDMRPGPGGYCDSDAEESSLQASLGSPEAQASDRAIQRYYSAILLVTGNPDGWDDSHNDINGVIRGKSDAAHTSLVKGSYTATDSALRTVDSRGLTVAEIERLYGSVRYMQLHGRLSYLTVGLIQLQIPLSEPWILAV